MAIQIELTVPSSLYGKTTAVVTGQSIDTGLAPCGDGCDYKLRPNEIVLLREIVERERRIAQLEREIHKLQHPHMYL